ncbi:ATP-binding protein [Thermoflavimicrobium dichotomicum]|uniref:Lon-like ATP-dependent protease n=1 Tax=Thermoflavimicrobium dichotomicum TaxID=46223 RepID=A0A1I3PKP3_9BACL|nr:ATP-binding protein [Thermoflavimicrobium dichotomicum]SFJ21907.1 Lon-like ATP-dependent protease [Thermoflavimicrobium dichotomicum]
MANGVLLQEQKTEPNTSWQTTEEIPIPARLIDQVIGQDRAVEIVRRAARARRSVLLIGEPGTGKSMLGRAMIEWMPPVEQEDVLIYPGQQDRHILQVKTVPAGQGKRMLEQFERKQQQERWASLFLFGMFVLTVLTVTGYLAWTRNQVSYFTFGLVVLFFGSWLVSRSRSMPSLEAPKLLVASSSSSSVPFIDATGWHAGGLLGDVRHDPYQSGNLATAPHHLVEPGAIHLAHGGVLFIDEVATLDIDTQQRLLTALQEKELSITGRNAGSSGTMVRTEPVPCDFVLVLAGNVPDLDKLHPALRSRIRGYGYEVVMADVMEDNAENREKLARFVAQEVAKDGYIPHFTREAVELVIQQARLWAGRDGKLSTRFRELGGLVRAAGDIAVDQGESLVLPVHVLQAMEMVRPAEEQIEERKGEIGR